MFAVFKREITSFFTSAMAYLIIGLFLLLNGLFLWVFKGDYNILDDGFSDLSNFFLLSPWVFLFLIPAITMKSFSEEKRLGTIELLVIKPVSLAHIVGGKFLAAFSLIVTALIPTLLYVYTLGVLNANNTSPDLGLAMGSYFGLLFLVANYVAMGIYASTITENQIVAFIAATTLCFLFYYGFDAIATLFGTGETVLFIRDLGMRSRVENMARGVLDTRDIIYFMSFALFFLYMAILQLKSLKH